MKNNNKTRITLNTIVQRIFIILLLLIIQNNFMNAQIAQPLGAQSSVFGNPYQEAAFTTPTITGTTTVCTGQTTTLTANSGYSSYVWSNGNITSSTTVGAGSYTVTVTDAIGCTRSNSVVVISNSCGLTLNLKCFIQGYYAGAGTMTPALMNQGIGTNLLLTDSITVELHNVISPYLLFDSRKVVLNTNGQSMAIFNSLSGAYYIVIKHRNGLETWSASPISFNTSVVTYDFSNANSKAYGSNQSEVESGVWAIYSGDITHDENIDLLDAALQETDINTFQFGYFATDINGDGNVDLLDAPIVETNINGFVFSSHP